MTAFTLNPKVLDKIRNAPVPTVEQVRAARVAVANSPRHGGDRRGSSTSRRRRTEKLLHEFGDGTTCPCSYCHVALTAETLTQDKIYTTNEGGGYRYENLIPACMDCNRRRLDTAIWEIVSEVVVAAEAITVEAITVAA